MRILQGFVHNGYTIIVNHSAAPEGGFRDAFSVHKHKDGDASDLRVTMHQRSITQARTFPTQDEAIESALTMARAWIDAQDGSTA